MTAPATPPPCAFCHDDLPQSPRSLLDDDGNYICDDDTACIARQQRQQAEKAHAIEVTL